VMILESSARASNMHEYRCDNFAILMCHDGITIFDSANEASKFSEASSARRRRFCADFVYAHFGVLSRWCLLGWYNDEKTFLVPTGMEPRRENVSRRGTTPADTSAKELQNTRKRNPHSRAL
jgi:hypothetical protein